MEKDYSKIIDAGNYTQGLAEHPDIPQSDTGIIRIISEKLQRILDREFRVLDLGCGPGRITKSISENLHSIAVANNVNLSIIGLDVSEGFISFARNYKNGENISYILADFLNYDFKEKFDVILMQGLFHHVSISDRRQWTEKCRDILNNNGVIIIGDEFIPEYYSENERVLNAAGLYAYVVSYALQNNNKSLAEIESMNMVDDVCVGLPGAGYSNDELIKFIQDTSLKIYTFVYEKGTSNIEYKNLVKMLVHKIKHDSEKISVNKRYNHNRGDYKISIAKQVEEFAKLKLKLERTQIYGPVKWFGGMAVLTFTRSD